MSCTNRSHISLILNYYTKRTHYFKIQDMIQDGDDNKLLQQENITQ